MEVVTMDNVLQPTESSCLLLHQLLEASVVADQIIPGLYPQ